MKLFRLLFVCCLFAVPAYAGDAEDIRQAEEYLQSLGQAQARFIQIAPDGSELTGTFYLSRPGRLLFQYDPPVKDFVVADGTFIYFYDAELGEQSNAPIGQTLADFILRDNLTLSGELSVKEVSRAGGLLQIEMIQTADPNSGSLRLGFSTNPFVLKKWRVTDAQGAITEVLLENLRTDVALNREMFYYHDPKKQGGPRYNN